jgi:hypothetical protein
VRLEHEVARRTCVLQLRASCNFVSKNFAKQTGITVRPVEYSVRLADDKATEVAGKATVYVHLGAFHKPVNCYVMDMLYEVDLMKSFLTSMIASCILARVA